MKILIIVFENFIDWWYDNILYLVWFAAKLAIGIGSLGLFVSFIFALSQK
jgi:hypothetical protein